MNKLLYKELSYTLQGAFFTIYKTFNNAHKENIYHNALIEELRKLKINTQNQKQLPVYYQNKKVGTYVPDLIVEDSILVELKCKPRLTLDDIKQFWHYLKVSDYKVGYLVNFGSIGKVEYIRRVYDTARTI